MILFESPIIQERNWSKLSRFLLRFFLVLSLVGTNLTALAPGRTALAATTANLAPSVNVGTDQTITIADSAFLDGAINDDSLPNTPAALTTIWSMVSGPGTVMFQNHREALTTATFSTTGTYVLRLTVSDGELSNSDELTIIVNNAHPNTIRVPLDYPTIQGGIDAAQVGDLVLVSPGTYVENLEISKTITLASTFYTTGDTTLIDQTVIRSPDILLPTVVVHSNTNPETMIVGFTIKDGKDGIKNRGIVKILNNYFVDLDTDGVDFTDGTTGLVQNNVMQNNGDDGVDLNNYIRALIQGNHIESNDGDGIEIRTWTNIGPMMVITIRENVISDNQQDGIQLIDNDLIGETSALLTIDRNLIVNNDQAGLGLMDDRTTSEDYRAASLLERINLFNNTFANNDHGVTGGDNLLAINNIFVDTTQIAVKNIDGSSIVAYNLFWNNGTDNIGSNLDLSTTLFDNPILDSTYHLNLGSPAFDAGTAQYTLASGEMVLDLPDSAYFGASPDLGAFESNFTTGNQRPSVDAGPDQAVTLPDSALLDGTVTDDGLPDPPGSVTITWNQVSGPAIVTFDDATAADSTASFSTDGVYILRLTASDGEASNSDDVTIVVDNDPPVAIDDSARTTVNKPVTIDVAANDNDPNGNLDLASTKTTCDDCNEPVNGALVNNGDGTFDYTPNSGFIGGDTFVYEICDTLGACDTAIVAMEVTKPEVFIPLLVSQ